MTCTHHTACICVYLFLEKESLLRFPTYFPLGGLDRIFVSDIARRIYMSGLLLDGAPIWFPIFFSPSNNRLIDKVASRASWDSRILSTEEIMTLLYVCVCLGRQTNISLTRQNSCLLFFLHQLFVSKV